tara:strand:+ start:2306 stop:2521 length:216 start_codon:yes stop_codon:yes gene_type:complete
MDSRNRQFKCKLALLMGRPLAMVGVLLAVAGALNRSSETFAQGIAVIILVSILAWTAKSMLFLFSSNGDPF